MVSGHFAEEQLFLFLLLGVLWPLVQDSRHGESSGRNGGGRGIR